MNLSNKQDFGNAIELAMAADRSAALDAIFDTIRDYEQAILVLDPVHGNMIVDRLDADMRELLVSIIK